MVPNLYQCSAMESGSLLRWFASMTQFQIFGCSILQLNVAMCSFIRFAHTTAIIRVPHENQTSLINDPLRKDQIHCNVNEMGMVTFPKLTLFSLPQTQLLIGRSQDSILFSSENDVLYCTSWERQSNSIQLNWIRSDPIQTDPTRENQSEGPTKSWWWSFFVFSFDSSIFRFLTFIYQRTMRWSINRWLYLTRSFTFSEYYYCFSTN